MMAAVPIIMGMSIGTCVTALLSSVGANKNAKRASMIHLLFNVIGATVWLSVFWIVKATLNPVFLACNVGTVGIPLAHSAFNLLCTALLLPMAGLFEKMVMKIIPDDKMPETKTELDPRLLTTPAIALGRCRVVASQMAEHSVQALYDALDCIEKYSPELAESVRANEEASDHYEDILGSYLVKLSSLQVADAATAESAMLLKAIGDLERISDHGVNILESVEELREKDIHFSESAQAELGVLLAAVREILRLTLAAFVNGDTDAIASISPLEEVVDDLKEHLRTAHILRLQQGDCTIDAGFIWADLLTDLERVSDHCSNISIGIIDLANHDMNIHENLRAIKADSAFFREAYERYSKQYSL